MRARFHGKRLAAAAAPALLAPLLLVACSERLVPPPEPAAPEVGGGTASADAGPAVGVEGAAVPRVVPETAPAPGTTPAAAPDGPDGPDAARLAADVTWLADDARAGRRAGTEGADEAAAWIAARMEALGLEPAGDDGYFHGLDVPLPPRDLGTSELVWSKVVDRGNERVVANEGPIRGAEHLAPLFCSAAAEAVGPLRFAGYGIVDTERGRDDLGATLTRSIVLVARGAPPGPDGASPEVWGHAGTLLGKVLAAKHNGARAVLVAQHPDDDTAPPPFTRGGTAEAGIPCMAISAELAERLVPGYGARVRWFDEGHAAAPEGGWAEVGAPDPGQANVWVRARVERGAGRTVNVLGRVPGTAGGPTVVVGAHYDGLGHGDTGSLAPDEIGAIHNGADDNDSGTAVALEAARLLMASPPRGDVVIALWSGEELGLLGSKRWVGEPTVDLEQVVAYLNLDMVGRAGNGELAVLGAGSAAQFEGWMDAAGTAAGLALKVSSSGRAMGGSDHMSFLGVRIPSLALFSGVHTDYHRPSDDADRVEADGMAKVTALVLELTGRIHVVGRRLAYVEPPPPAEGESPGGEGFRAWFGSVPEYAQEEGLVGVLLAGTSPGSPAEAAGLAKGDVLKQVGEVEIGNIYDFMHSLSYYKAGDTVLVTYERAGALEEVRLTLSTRGAR